MDLGPLAGQQRDADMVMVTGIVRGTAMIVIVPRTVGVMVRFGHLRPRSVVGGLDCGGGGQGKDQHQAKRPQQSDLGQNCPHSCPSGTVSPVPLAAEVGAQAPQDKQRGLFPAEIDRAVGFAVRILGEAEGSKGRRELFPGCGDFRGV